MTSDPRFTDDEWNALAAGPSAAAAAILGIGHPGFFGTMKELKASLKAIKHTPTDPPAAELVHQLMEYAKAHPDVGAEFDAEDSDIEETHAAALEALGRAGTVARKLTPEEARGYLAWLTAIAWAVAEAARDKGDKKPVSESEAEVLATIEQLLQTP